MGEESHLSMLERQHQIFLSVHKHLEKARKRQKKYADRGAVAMSFDIGQAVLFRNKKTRQV